MRDPLAVSLEQLLQQMSAESRFHLATALNAAQTAGVGGTLVIDVPRKNTDHVQVKWLGGGHTLDVEIGSR